MQRILKKTSQKVKYNRKKLIEDKDKEIFQEVELKKKDKNQRTIPGSPTSRDYGQSRKKT